MHLLSIFDGIMSDRTRPRCGVESFACPNGYSADCVTWYGCRMGTIGECISVTGQDNATRQGCVNKNDRQ